MDDVKSNGDKKVTKMGKTLFFLEIHLDSGLAAINKTNDIRF